MICLCGVRMFCRGRQVKPGFEEAFKQASIANARASMTEGGIHR